MTDGRSDLVVVGGGQAGLAAGYWATQLGIDHVILDAASRIGDSWRDRYDSLELFTPRAFSQLPGLAPDGDPDGYPGKDEIAGYLAAYARHHALPVMLDSPVSEVRDEGSSFTLSTATDRYEAGAVIVATGPFHTPSLPPWAAEVRAQQLHSAAYRRPEQIVGPRVLVVGGGNSGAQIAEELTTAGLEVSWSVSADPRFMPARILGGSVFWWLDVTGALTAPTESRRARLLRRRGDPIFGTAVRTLVRSRQLTMLPVAVEATASGVGFGDGTSREFDTVVWCTGFDSDYSFLKVPGALDGRGLPLHEGGVSTVNNHLGFLGLGWQRSRNSALLGGVGADAERLVVAVTNRADAATRPVR